jgi:hypothetical protein
MKKKTQSKGVIGRPPVPDDRKKAKVGFSLPQDVSRAVREMAGAKGVSISKVVEDALMRAIAEYHLNRE